MGNYFESNIPFKTWKDSRVLKRIVSLPVLDILFGLSQINKSKEWLNKSKVKIAYSSAEYGKKL